MILTEHTWKDAITQLVRADQKLAKVILSVNPVSFDFTSHPLHALIRAVIGQQLSYKAACAISERFFAAIGAKPDAWASKIIALPIDTIRSCGLSQSKAGCLKNIAVAIAKDSINLDTIQHKTNAEVIELMTQVKGIGAWTAEMFLIFGLKRSDVLSKKDAALRKSIIRIYHPKNAEKIESTFNYLDKSWSPYQSVASWYLWKALY